MHRILTHSTSEGQLAFRRWTSSEWLRRWSVWMTVGRLADGSVPVGANSVCGLWFRFQSFNIARNKHFSHPACRADCWSFPFSFRSIAIQSNGRGFSYSIYIKWIRGMAVQCADDGWMARIIYILCKVCNRCEVNASIICIYCYHYHCCYLSYYYYCHSYGYDYYCYNSNFYYCCVMRRFRHCGVKADRGWKAGG